MTFGQDSFTMKTPENLDYEYYMSDMLILKSMYEFQTDIKDVSPTFIIECTQSKRLDDDSQEYF